MDRQQVGHHIWMMLLLKEELKGLVWIREPSHSSCRKIMCELHLYTNPYLYTTPTSVVVLVLVLLFWNLGAKASAAKRQDYLHRDLKVTRIFQFILNSSFIFSTKSVI